MFSNCGLSLKGGFYVSHQAHGSLRGRHRLPWCTFDKIVEVEVRDEFGLKRATDATARSHRLLDTLGLSISALDPLPIQRRQGQLRVRTGSQSCPQIQSAMWRRADNNSRHVGLVTITNDGRNQAKLGLTGTGLLPATG